jgi:hypothetical protein
MIHRRAGLQKSPFHRVFATSFTANISILAKSSIMFQPKDKLQIISRVRGGRKSFTI